MTSEATRPAIEGEEVGPLPAVNSYTEWDPLREVVVGTLAGGVFPTWQDSMAHVVPDEAQPVFREQGGLPFPADHLKAAEAELDALAEVLTAEGVTVVRPDPVVHQRPIRTPAWESPGGLYAGMPRDLLMVMGDAIIEAPMSWRCRYHEVDAFRSLIKAYFLRGARWLPAPRPQLTDELFRSPGGDRGKGARWALTEFEPVFDAADFCRFGTDVVVQRSHVTNQFGIDWVRRSMGRDFTVSVIETNDPHAMHIDATLAPLAPGKLLVHPERYVPCELFEGWEILSAPPPTLPSTWPMYFCSPWVSMNVLSLDPETVVVERQERPLIEALTGWGFRCVPVDFRHVYSFGGSFHCVTLDTVREGGPRKFLAGRPDTGPSAGYSEG
ncbi:MULTISPECIES: amidinotransferase [unclassified Streptomyces]|uniref:amidinotransferase n=1 Tax=unclassified Streptomyces TaxID=2593676 RepID=UPI002DDA3504|nr:amidinotransferase [Streptomyces sp. NBC_01795]WSA90373.1 amidinotransferase [Streptomyces sp. NBC_01795]WSS45759.1 amidinotransferase [Streptomyces sp. NBC_01187]